MAADAKGSMSVDLASVEFRRGALTLRITIRLGDVLDQAADIAALKYAQALHGLDRDVISELSSMDPTLARRLPLPGSSLVVPTNERFPFQTVVVVGTETLGHFGPDAIRDWARLAYRVCADVLSAGLTDSSGSVVSTAQGVRTGGGRSVEPTRSLAAIVNGLLDGVTEALANPTDRSVRHVILAERDEAIARPLAEELRRLKAEFDPPEAEQPVTPTVASVRTELGVDEVVTASRLAESVRMRHPEYGQGAFGRCTFPDRGSTATVREWLSRVALLYPEAQRDPAFQLTGRHVVVGLALLDNVVGDAMRAQGAYEAAVGELREKPTDPRERHEVRWASDTPVDSRGDRIGRVLVARSLARHLSDFDQQQRGASFALLLDGRWGAGKSSMLSMLVEEFEARQRTRLRSDPYQPSTVVRFDAWRQCRAGPPWLRLMEATRDGLREAKRYGARAALRERLRLVERWRLGLLALMVAALVVFCVLWIVDVVQLDSLEKRLGTTISLVTVLGFARTVRSSLLPRSEREARAFVDGASEPMEELAEQFLWLRRLSKGPTLLLIDDVDRCDPSYVVELLDSVQKLVRGEQLRRDRQPTIFIVVAADGRWVRTAYETAHPDQANEVGEPGRPLGALFLDKIFQVRVSLPELSPQLQSRHLAAILDQRGATQTSDVLIADAREKIRSSADRGAALEVMRQLPPGARLEVAADALERLESAEDSGHSEAQHALVRFGNLLEANPRSVLRFVMAFSALRAARLAEGNPVSTDSLALWTIVSVRWPLLAEFLAAEPDERIGLFAALRADVETHSPATLHSLFNSPPAELRAVFNHQPGGPLDAPTIKQCSGLA